MSILYGAVQGVAGLKAEALSIHLSKTPKYHLRAGLQYLHQSGNHLQTGSKWAWVGTIDQARAMRRRSDAAAGCRIRAIEAVPQHYEEIQ